MRARDVMVTDFEVVPASMPLLDAVKRLRARKLETGRVDVRCLVVDEGDGAPKHLLTEADVVRAILPWFFREKKFSDFVSRWLSKDLPPAALDELYADLTRRARKKTVKDILGEADLISVDAEDSLLKLAYTMHSERIKTVPVVRDGKIVGIVFRTAVFEAIADEMERETQAEVARERAATGEKT
jgi:CBS domain-containing protein